MVFIFYGLNINSPVQYVFGLNNIQHCYIQRKPRALNCNNVQALVVINMLNRHNFCCLILFGSIKSDL